MGKKRHNNSNLKIQQPTPAVTPLTIEEQNKLIHRGWVGCIDFIEQYYVPLNDALFTLNTIVSHLSGILASNKRAHVPLDPIRKLAVDIGDVLNRVDILDREFANQMDTDTTINIEYIYDIRENAVKFIADPTDDNYEALKQATLTKLGEVAIAQLFDGMKRYRNRDKEKTTQDMLQDVEDMLNDGVHRTKKAVFKIVAQKYGVTLDNVSAQFYKARKEKRRL